MISIRSSSDSVWRNLLVRAEQEEWPYEQFHTVLVTEEIAQRQQTRLALLGSALSSEFVNEGRSLILVGKPGRGRTHLAVAIGYRAIQNDFTTRFVTGVELIDNLSESFSRRAPNS